MHNSAINLSVTNNPDGGFTLSGVLPAGYSFSITSGNVTMQGGAVIQNGQLLIGNQTGNSFDQGNLIGGNGITLDSGAGSLTIHASNYPLSQNISYATGITPVLSGYNTLINVSTLTGNLFLKNPTGNKLDGYLLTFRFQQDSSGRYISYDNQYYFGTSITTGFIPTNSGAKFELGLRYVESDNKWRAVGFAGGF